MLPELLPSLALLQQLQPDAAFAPILPNRLDDCSRLEIDRKSTRLNSSHITISYAVFCLKKKKNSSRIWLYEIMPLTIHPASLIKQSKQFISLPNNNYPTTPTINHYYPEHHGSTTTSQCT